MEVFSKILLLAKVILNPRDVTFIFDFRNFDYSLTLCFLLEYK